MNLGPLGLPEIIIILVVALLLFGVKGLPKMARDVGKLITKTRKEIKELKDDIDITKVD